VIYSEVQKFLKIFVKNVAFKSHLGRQVGLKTIGNTGHFCIGCDLATNGQFPWQASLQTESGGHFCGASIISSTFLNTAAH